MKKIVLLTDYKGYFGSRHDAEPYRSGMDLSRLQAVLRENGFDTELMPFSRVDPSDSSWKQKIVLYTSSEDPGLIYKQYIEDIVFALTMAGADVIPRFEFLRANNNKVFMELLRELLPDHLKGNLKSTHYGTLEELDAIKDTLDYPVVVKGYSGAMGRNVHLAHNAGDLLRIIRKRVTSLSPLRLRIKEHIRQVIHRGYRRDSFSRGRFIVQPFIPGLRNDWKVYYFGEKAFVFYRPVFPKRIFRASGGGYDNYRYGLDAEVPEGLLDFGYNIFGSLRVPNASLDIAWDGSRFFLLEFQCVYFGTAGILKRYSGECFVKQNSEWIATPNTGDIEKTYADSISWFTGQMK